MRSVFGGSPGGSGPGGGAGWAGAAIDCTVIDSSCCSGRSGARDRRLGVVDRRRAGRGVADRRRAVRGVRGALIATHTHTKIDGRFCRQLPSLEP